MKFYNSKHPSGVRGYTTGNNDIILEFVDGNKYLYNYKKSGKQHVEK